MYFIPLLQSETCTLVRFRFVLYSIDVIIVLDCTLLLAPANKDCLFCQNSNFECFFTFMRNLVFMAIVE